MKSKTMEKLRKSFDEWISEFAEADIIGNGEFIWEFTQKQISASVEEGREETIKEVLVDLEGDWGLSDYSNIKKHLENKLKTKK